MERRLTYAEKGKDVLREPELRRTIRIRTPELDTSKQIKENTRTIIGRLTNRKEQSMRLLLVHLPKKWNLKGKATGSELDEESFQFRFEFEENLAQVLENRPY